jgi:GDPmannose 4,6-dehydratase
MMNRVAVITGITGQDGAYLAALLIEKGYRVVGLVRSYHTINVKGLKYLGIDDQVELVECDLSDLSQVLATVKHYLPSEIYNLAAQSSVSLSFKQPIGTIQYNVVSVLNILEAIRMINPEIRFYQASSSEVFGDSELPIRETTYINPISPYSISKASAHWITKNYRDSYGLFSCSGFLFNHESYLRSDNFFVKKVVSQAVKIKRGLAETLEVGNIDIKRDFGWAPKYVEAMYLILQQEKPEDFLICSNQSVTLRSVIEYVFNFLDISISRLVIDEELFRPTEIIDIYGDNTKAREKLGWKYDMSFFDVLAILIDEELANGRP